MNTNRQAVPDFSAVIKHLMAIAINDMRATFDRDLNADELAMFDGADCDSLGDWIDDLEARLGLHVADVRSSMLDFRFAKFPPKGERVLFRDVDGDNMWDSADGFDPRPYDPTIAHAAMDTGFVIDVNGVKP